MLLGSDLIQLQGYQLHFKTSFCHLGAANCPLALHSYLDFGSPAIVDFEVFLHFSQFCLPLLTVQRHQALARTYALALAHGDFAQDAADFGFYQAQATRLDHALPFHADIHAKMPAQQPSHCRQGQDTQEDQLQKVADKSKSCSTE